MGFTDEHCHILWGVDDGSRSLDESLAMLDAAVTAGITSMVCTPHMRWKDFDQDLVKQRFEELDPHAQERGIQLSLAYEVYYPRLMRLGLDQAVRFVRQGTNQILLEFNSGDAIDPDWERTVWKLQSSGLDVTFAHPERYTSVQDDFSLVARMRAVGCKVQVSAGDVLGGPFDKVAKCARRIVKEGLCDAFVTDAHRSADYETFVKAAKKVKWNW